MDAIISEATRSHIRYLCWYSTHLRAIAHVLFCSLLLPLQTPQTKPSVVETDGGFFFLHPGTEGGALGRTLVSSLHSWIIISVRWRGWTGCTAHGVTAFPGRERSGRRSLTAICSSSAGTSHASCENLEGFLTAPAGRNQILRGKLIFRRAGMWRQLLKSRFGSQACQRKQNNAVQGPICKKRE